MKSFLLAFFGILCYYCSQAQLVELNDEKIVNVHSQILNRDQKIFIRLPRNYDQTSIKYPVVYLFDANDKTLFNYASSVIDRLMWTHDIPDVILVGIAQNDRSKELGTERNEAYSDKFRTFIKDELLPNIEKKYRTADFRVLIGHSLGGQFVTTAMITYPKTFKSVISISAALNNPPTDTAFKGKTILKLDKFLQSNPNDKLYYYFSVGDSGFQDELFQKGNLKVDSLFKKHPQNTVKYKFNYLKGSNHGTTPLISIPDGLIFIFNDWHFSDSLAMSVLVNGKTDPIEAIDKQSKRIRDSYGADISIPVFIYWQFADYYFEKGQYAKAKIVLQKNIDLDPNSHYPYGKMGEIFDKTNKPLEAIKYYTLAITKFTTNDNKEDQEKYESRIKALKQQLNK
ncbi:MAG: alpha/beta fold hydrolase [Mucilaginibacter sp.]|uniref:alpha/beta fold hydrolase n=1 Tax=Mucilaginibacter sp. TaxID=1882438 RepID=UPI0034E4EB15